MLRGTAAAFTGLATMLLLRRRLRRHEWAGIALVFSGSAIVGATAVLQPSGATARHPLLGGVCIVGAQARGGKG